MCPVLLFTTEVKQALDWFDECYELEGGFGYVRWHRVALPLTGGINEQPAKLLEQMAYIADVRNTDLARDRPKRRGRGKEHGKRG